MVEIEKSPATISLAGNPISFTVKGGNALGSGSKLKAYAYMDFSRELQTLDQFYISINNTVYTFYVIGFASDNDEGNVRFIPIPDGASSIDVVGLAKHLNNHPDLRKNFSFTPDSDSGEIRMTAKNLDRYEIDAGSQGDQGLTVTCTQVLHGGAASIRENYAMHERVYLPDIDSNNAIAELLLSPDNNGRNSNDIGEFLHPYFSLDLHITPSEIVYEQPKLLLRYQTEFWESYPNFLSLITPSSGDLWALPGRRSALELAKDNNGTFEWLSNFKGVKNVYRGYPEKLFYIVEPGYKYKVYLYHGDSSSIILADGIVPEKRTVLEINVDPGTIETVAGIVLEDYSVAVYKEYIPMPGEIGLGKLSSKREFRISQPPSNLKVFLFVNEYGMPETAFLHGTKTHNLNISRELLQVEGTEAADKPLGSSLNHEFKVGSGFVDKATWLWLCEMQRSLQVYEILNEDNMLYACVLTNTKSMEVADTDLYAHEFEYTYVREGSIPFESQATISFIFDNTFDNTYN